MLTECIAKARDMKVPLYTTLLDASKAFDVVSHNALLEAMHLHGVDGRSWLLMKDWYSEMSSKVKWNNIISREIVELQGLRQGGGLSAGQYTMYTNNNLISLEEADLGMKIGTQFVGCPTCADDTVLVHTSCVDMQVAINKCKSFSEKYRFQFSETK